MSALQEPPAKRLKLSTNTLYDRIPDIEQVHAECRNRLKSSFESIFEKYSHDFGGISDEIDQKTGNVVADRGHLQGMRAPGDVGLERAENARNDKSRSQEPVDDNDSEDELLGGHKSPPRKLPPKQQNAMVLYRSSLRPSVPTNRENANSQESRLIQGDTNGPIQPQWNSFNPAAMELFTETVAMRVARLMTSGAVATTQPQSAPIAPSIWDAPPLPSDGQEADVGQSNISKIRSNFTPDATDSGLDGASEPAPKTSHIRPVTSESFKKSVWAVKTRKTRMPRPKIPRPDLKHVEPTFNGHGIPTPPASAEKGQQSTKDITDPVRKKSPNRSRQEESQMVRRRISNSMAYGDITRILPNRTYQGARTTSKKISKIPGFDRARQMDARIPWSIEETKLLLDLKDSQRLQWDDLHKRFPGRTLGSVRTRYWLMKRSASLESKTTNIGKAERPDKTTDQITTSQDGARDCGSEDSPLEADPVPHDVVEPLRSRLRVRGHPPQYNTNRRQRVSNRSGLAQVAQNGKDIQEAGEPPQASNSQCEVDQASLIETVQFTAQAMAPDSQGDSQASAVDSSPPEKSMEKIEAGADKTAYASTEQNELVTTAVPDSSRQAHCENNKRRGRPKKHPAIVACASRPSSTNAAERVRQTPSNVQETSRQGARSPLRTIQTPARARSHAQVNEDSELNNPVDLTLDTEEDSADELAL